MWLADSSETTKISLKTVHFSVINRSQYGPLKKNVAHPSSIPSQTAFPDVTYLGYNNCTLIGASAQRTEITDVAIELNSACSFGSLLAQFHVVYNNNDVGMNVL